MSFAERLKGLREVNLAFAKADAKSGNKRAERKARRKLLRAAQEVEKKLMKKVSLITPNIPEAEILTGVHIKTKEDMILAANKLIKFGAKNIFLCHSFLSFDTL